MRRGSRESSGAGKILVGGSKANGQRAYKTRAINKIVVSWPSTHPCSTAISAAIATAPDRVTATYNERLQPVTLYTSCGPTFCGGRPQWSAVEAKQRRSKGKILWSTFQIA